MELEGKEPKGVGAIELVVGDSHSLLFALPSEKQWGTSLCYRRSRIGVPGGCIALVGLWISRLHRPSFQASSMRKAYLTVHVHNETAAAEGIVVMESESKELKGVGAIELALGDSQSSFFTLPSRNSKALSCATGDPKSVFLMVELLHWGYGFPVCLGQTFERVQRAKAYLTVLVHSENQR
ncbi:uncharacterized protein LOC116203702 isoform X2 [Punica granatum]|uniref:Uncharacterized protein LOC116203702 isoform X2 n=1 Tax=Punica granatum TaxID=22663 RepID=A0A6P8DD74_PUNGR|nr:uncharacterized protein LOC116203702 isoform X2 [Punica granatum]